MVKYLVRGEKGNFLEARVENSAEMVIITPTKIEVNPRELVHFGSDVITNGWDLHNYSENMKTQGEEGKAKWMEWFQGVWDQKS